MIRYTEVLEMLCGPFWHNGPCDPIDCGTVAVWARCMQCAFHHRLIIAPGLGGSNQNQWCHMQAALMAHKQSLCSHPVQLWYSVAHEAAQAAEPAHTVNGKSRRLQQAFFDAYGALLPSCPMRHQSNAQHTK